MARPFHRDPLFPILSQTVTEWMTLMVFSGAPDAPTPFETDLQPVGSGDWTQLVFSWADLAKAEWVGDEGIAEIDPSRVTGYGISIGAGQGTLWVDDVALVGGEAPQPAPVTAPTEAPAASTEAPSDEGEEAGGGICFSPMVLPLGVMGVFLASRRRRT